MAADLRVACARELQANQETYERHPHLCRVASELDIPLDTLIFSLLNDDSIRDAQTSSGSLHLEIERSSNTGRWSTLLHVLALSNVLDREIISVFPDAKIAHRKLIHAVVKPTESNVPPHDLSDISKNCQAQSLVILWSREGCMDNTQGLPYEPNHVVPLVRRSAVPGPAPARLNDAPKKQANLFNYFCTYTCFNC